MYLLRLLLERREAATLMSGGEQVLLRGQDVRQLPPHAEEMKVKSSARMVRQFGVAADREHVGGDDAAEPVV